MANIDSLYSPGITRRDHRIPEDYLKSVTDVFKSFEWNFSKDGHKINCQNCIIFSCFLCFAQPFLSKNLKIALKQFFTCKTPRASYLMFLWAIPNDFVDIFAAWKVILFFVLSSSGMELETLTRFTEWSNFFLSFPEIALF